jgi:hypothetical protein
LPDSRFEIGTVAQRGKGRVATQTRAVGEACGDGFWQPDLPFDPSHAYLD